MKKYLYILAIIVTTLLGVSYANAQYVLQGPQGGTGIGSGTAGDVGKCLKILSVGPLVWNVGTCAAGGGGSGGTWATSSSPVAGQNFNYPIENDDIVLIGNTSSTTAPYWFDPNTLDAFLTGFRATRSTTTGATSTTIFSTLGRFDNLVLTNALSILYGGTGLTSVSASSTVMQSNGTAIVYQKLSPGNFTTSNVSQWTNDSGYESGLTAGDGLTRTVNDFDCDTADTSTFGCLTDIDWDTFNNKVPTSITLTAGNGLTGGGDLSANRTFTVGAGTGITVNGDDVALTIPVVISSGGTNATSFGILQTPIVFDGTRLVATTSIGISDYFIATTTATSSLPRVSSTGLSTTWLCLTGDICRTTWPTGGGAAFPFDPVASGNATNTLLYLYNGVYATGSSTLQYASTTVTSATTFCFTGDGCRTTWPSGGAGAYPFTPTTNYNAATNATTGVVWFQNGLQASTTSQIQNASTTGISAAFICFTADTCRTTWPSGSGSGYTFYDNEDVAGTINGSNVAFTIGTAPNPAADLKLFLGNILQVQGIDYTLSGTNITYTVAPPIELAGLPHKAFYRTAVGAGGSWAYPFIADTNYGAGTNSTTSVLWFKNGIQASTTSQIAYASTTQVSANSICFNSDTCRTTWPTGGGFWPFTVTDTNYNVAVQSTTTPEWFKNGLMASTTSYFVYASTTALTAASANILRLDNLSSAGFVKSSANGTLSVDTSTYLTGNQTITLTGDVTGSGATSISTTYNNTVPIAKGGTNATAFDAPQTMITFDGTKLVSTSSIGYFDYINATTTATSTLPRLSSTGLSTTWLCLTGDSCRTTWPSAGAGSYPFSPTTNYAVNTNATTGVVWFQNGLQASTTSHFVYASTTALSAVSICLTSDTCRTTWPSGGSGTYPFSPTTNYNVATNATTGVVWFQNGLQASTTSQIAYASTTALSATSICLTGDNCRTTWPVGRGGSPISGTTTPVTITASTVDTLQPHNYLSTTTDPYLVFNSSPPAGTWFGIQIHNADTDFVKKVNFPNSYSPAKGRVVNYAAAPPSLDTVNGDLFLHWYYDGTRYTVFDDMNGIDANNGTYSTFYGTKAGQDATGAEFSTYFGYGAGQNAPAAGQSVGVGYNAGKNPGGYAGTFVGYSAGANGGGTSAVGLGYTALASAGVISKGTGNVAIGTHAAEAVNTLDETIAIGYHTANQSGDITHSVIIGGHAGPGLNGTSTNSIFLGAYSGMNRNSTLWIDGESTGINTIAPLIYGEFDNDILTVNGKLGVGTSSPYAKLSVHGVTGQTYTNTLFAVASSTPTATTTHFAVLANGNVGIGTSSPGTMLGVAGVGVFGDRVTASYFTATSSATSTLPRVSSTGVATDWLCLTGDSCRASWPTGGGSAYPFDPTTNYNTNVNATTGLVWFQNGLHASTTSQIAYASTTAISATNFCFIGDICRSTWPSGTSKWTDDGSFTYLNSTTDDLVLGSLTVANAPFYWDVSATTSYIGNGGTGDSTVTLGKSAFEWSLGYDVTDNTFAIASSTELGTNNALTINKSTLGTTLVSLTLGTDLTVANGGTGLSTFGGTNHVLYTTAADALASEAAFTYNAGTDTLTATNGTFSGGTLTAATLAGALDAGGATSFEIPNGTGPTLDATGEIGFDTTDNQLQIATTSAATARVIPTVQKLWAATVASTSPDLLSGGRIWLPPQRDGFDVTEIHCAVDGGTSVVINISNSGGTTDSETVTCDADGATDTSIDTNSVYAAGSLNSLEVGTVTGTVDYLTFSVWGLITRE